MAVAVAVSVVVVVAVCSRVRQCVLPKVRSAVCHQGVPAAARVRVCLHGVCVCVLFVAVVHCCECVYGVGGGCFWIVDGPRRPHWSRSCRGRRGRTQP